MAITPTAAQLAILRLNQTLFGTAVGTTAMAAALPSFTGNIDTDGNNYAQSLIDNTSALKILSPAQLFERVVNNISTNNITAADKAPLVEALVAFHNVGLSVGATVNLLSAFLYINADTLNNVWSNTAKQVKNQTTVASYYTLDAGNSAASTSALSGVTSDPATVQNAINSSTGQAFTFTTGIDNLVGGAGNDTFNATQTGTSVVLGGLDVADGGAGTNTMSVADTNTAATADFFLPTGITIKNIQNLNVTTNGSIGKGGTTDFDISGLTSVTKATFVAAGTGSGTGSQVLAAGLTTAPTTAQDISLTVAGSDTATVKGGKNVTVVAGTGAVDVTGGNLATVTVNKGGGATIDNTDTAGTTSIGTSLTTVTLTSVDGASAIKGKGLTTFNISGATTAARTITVTNAAVGHAATVNVDGTGYKADGTAAQTVFVDNAATTITVNATGSKSSLALTGSGAVTTANVTGSAALSLLTNLANLTTINGSTATGNLTLGTVHANTVTVKTGAGNDSATINATTKSTIDTGAGNDTLTLASALAASSTISLGAGNDKLVFATGGSVATSTSTVIDGGDGTDSIAARLITAGNAAQFKNFENIDLSGDNTATTVDVNLMTGSTISGLTLTSGTGAVTVQNVAAGAGLTVGGAGVTSGTTTIYVNNAATGTADTFTLTFNGDAVTAVPGAANVLAGTVALPGIETVNIVSGGGTNTWNSVTLTDASAKSVVITGSQNLDFTMTNQTVSSGKIVLTSIDGSAATGKLTISETSALHTATSLTIKGGTNNDTITIGAGGNTTITGGGGNDTFVVATATSNVTAGAGATTAADLAGTLMKTTITDFNKGDKITLAATGTPVWTATKVDVSAAQNLGAALDLAAAGDGTANGIIKWLVWGADSYIVNDNLAAATVGVADIVVKITGVTDLSSLTLDTATLTFA